MLRFYRQPLRIWLALFALCLHVMLPYAHAAQMQGNAHHASCATSPDKPTAPGHPASAAAAHCTVCLACAAIHVALPPGPLPVLALQQSLGLLQTTQSSGFFVPAWAYAQPQSHAPPVFLN